MANRRLPPLRDEFDPVTVGKMILRDPVVYWSTPLAFDGEDFYAWEGRSDQGPKDGKPAVGRWKKLPLTLIRLQWLPMEMERHRIRQTIANRNDLLAALEAHSYVPEHALNNGRLLDDDPWGIAESYDRWHGAARWGLPVPEDDGTDEQPREAAS